MTVDLLLSGQFWIFAILAIVTLVSTYRMVVTPLITHAALFMALSFTAVAGIFLLMQAEFVAAIQVLIYAGAITTMVIFAIMLSGLKDIRADVAGKMARRVSGSGVFAFVVAAVFAAFMSYLYYAAKLGPAIKPETVYTLSESIAPAIFTTYMIPFEIASLLLLIAMVGAIILTAKEMDE